MGVRSCMTDRALTLTSRLTMKVYSRKVQVLATQLREGLFSSPEVGHI